MRWRVLNKIKAEKPQERQKEILKALFKNRGLKTKKQKEDFLSPKDPRQLTPKEVGISSVQLTKAIKRIKKAVKKKEKIIVYGDYDADGICATAIVWEALHEMGADAMPFIPRREEGYALKVDRIDRMAKEGVSLIITVDQGITHSQPVAHAQKLGVDVIVTDHHLPGKKTPKAAAIVHTTKLAGCGVAWFLARLISSEVAPKSRRGLLRGEDGLDLATIGTVTDVVPLVGPNRSVIWHGLEAVRKTKRSGLRALYESAGLDKQKIGPYEIGYIIGPRLNASGRVDDPVDSLRLVCTRSAGRAHQLAQEINQKNQERQDLANQITLHAREIWLEEGEGEKLIFIHHQSFEYGVIGLAASKLKDEFYRPAVVLAPRQDHWAASARSIEEFNIVKAIRTCADILQDHGGHKLAAGFSVASEKIEELKERLQKTAEGQLGKMKLSRTLKIDVEVDLADLNYELLEEINKLAPFGEGNPQPVFATPGVEVGEARTVGRAKQHLKLSVRGQVSGTKFGAIAFGKGDLYEQLSPGRPIDIAYNFQMNEWNGKKSLQLKVRDIKV